MYTRGSLARVPRLLHVPRARQCARQTAGMAHQKALSFHVSSPPLLLLSTRSSTLRGTELLPPIPCTVVALWPVLTRCRCRSRSLNPHPRHHLRAPNLPNLTIPKLTFPFLSLCDLRAWRRCSNQWEELLIAPPTIYVPLPLGDASCCPRIGGRYATRERATLVPTMSRVAP